MNKHPEDIRTTGVLNCAYNVIDAAVAMIDDCRFIHTGDGGRIGGEVEDELLTILSKLNHVQEDLRDYMRDYC